MDDIVIDNCKSDKNLLNVIKTTFKNKEKNSGICE